MKTFEFNETEGFNFGTKVLQEMQSAYSIVTGVAKMAGEKSIISGCEELGETVSDGVVFINGELLDFKSAVKQSTVVIKEEITQRVFENGVLKDFSKYRYATFGFSFNSFNWVDFKRVTPLNRLEERIAKLEKAAAPIINGGGRVLFLKPANEIPPGWEEDTTFAGRMPVGIDLTDTDFDTVGKSGGKKNHKLTISELPNHSFKIFGATGIDTAKIVNNPEGTAAAQGDSPNANEDWNYEVTSAPGEAFAGKTNSLGSGQEHNNMSPYRIVIYIKYVG